MPIVYQMSNDSLCKKRIFLKSFSHFVYFYPIILTKSTTVRYLGPIVIDVSKLTIDDVSIIAIFPNKPTTTKTERLRELIVVYVVVEKRHF